MTSTPPPNENHPGLGIYSFSLSNGEEEILRPLQPGDVSRLGNFLMDLSEETKRFVMSAGSVLPSASELCEAIDKYDKLRFVVETVPTSDAPKRIIGLMEFSLGVPDGDIERYKSAGYELNEDTDCRFGPTIADDYQNVGLGTKLFPYVTDIAQKLGKKRIILWGGVLKDNERAIHYYKKHGFKVVGTFTDGGEEMVDMILDLNE